MDSTTAKVLTALMPLHLRTRRVGSNKGYLSVILKFDQFGHYK